MGVTDTIIPVNRKAHYGSSLLISWCNGVGFGELWETILTIRSPPNRHHSRCFMYPKVLPLRRYFVGYIVTYM